MPDPAHPLLSLTDDEREFVVQFVLRSGSLKDLAEHYGVSYPTLRGRLDRVIEHLREAVAGRPADPMARRQELIHPFSRFRLARLYEETGQKAKAMAQYDKLVEIWSKADAGLPYVEEARAARARLKGR